MSIKETHDKHLSLIPAVSAGAGLGVLGSELLGHAYFGNKTNLSHLTMRPLVAGLATAGMLYPIERRLHRSAARTQEKIVNKEAHVMNNWYNSTDYNEFKKIASRELGDVVNVIPEDLQYDAFKLYSNLPEENREATVSALYEAVTPGMNKVAMEMVAANVLNDTKTASIVAGAKAVGSRVGGFAGKAFEPAMTSAGIYSSTKDRLEKDRNHYQQGRSFK